MAFVAPDSSGSDIPVKQYQKIISVWYLNAYRIYILQYYTTTFKIIPCTTIANAIAQQLPRLIISCITKIRKIWGRASKLFHIPVQNQNSAKYSYLLLK